MKKTKLSLYFLVIAFFTFITIFSVIVQKSYSNLMGPIQEVKKSTLLNPINPTLDISIIQQVESRIEYSSGILPSTPSVIISSPSAEI